MKFYHSTNLKLPKSFVVKKNSSAFTLMHMDDEGLEDFEGGLFVSPEKDYSHPYGKYIYEISAKSEPLMMSDWVSYVFPVGTRVWAKRVL